MGVGDNIKKNTEAQKQFNQAAEEGLYTYREYTDILKSINEELGAQYSTTKEARGEYNQLIKSAQTLTGQQESLTRLSDKELNTLAEKAAINVANLQALAQNVVYSEQMSDAEMALLIGKESNFETERMLLATIQEEVKERQRSNQLMGVAGGLAATLDGLLGPMSKALGLDQMKKDMQEVADRVAKTGESFGRLKVLATGLKGAMSGIAGALTDPSIIFGGIMSGYNDVAKAQKEFRQQTGQNISHVDTLNSSIATSADYMKAAVSLSKELGVNASVVFSPETITEVAELTELMGMGAHEAAQLAKFAKLSGKELSTVTAEMEAGFKQFVQTNKVGINFTDVMNDVGKVSASVSLSLGSNPAKIQAAAMEARKLGVSLEQVDKIAGSLLNFEESISAELEAELLTGKQLNLEKARQYALANDLEGVARELAKNEGIMKAFSSGNRIQQEASAKAMGMSREEMAKMIYQQKIQSGLSAEQAAKAADISLEEAKRLTAQEQIKKSLDKITQAVGGFLTYLDPILSNTTMLSIVLGTIATVYVAKMASGFAKSAKGVFDMAKGAKDMLKNLSKSGGIFGKFYKGGQFTPGGGRAKAGGERFGGIFGKALPKKEDSEKIKGATDGTKGIKPGQGKGIKDFLKGLGDGLAALGKKAGQVLKGALVLGVVGVILGGSFALALMMVKDVDPIQMIAFAGSLAILGITMALLGNLGANIIMGAIAMGILALALIPAAFAFSLLENVSIEKMIAFSLMLPLLALAAAGLGFLAPFIIMGSWALMALGLAMIPAAYAFSLLGEADMVGIAASFEGLGEKAAALASVGPALFSVAAGLMAFNAAILVGTAGGFLGKLIGGGGPLADIERLAEISPQLATTASALTEMATALRSVAQALDAIDGDKLNDLEDFAVTSAITGAVTGIFSAITAPITMLGDMLGGSPEEKNQEAIINRLDRLIALTEQGKTIEMDGNKVGKTLALTASEMG
jgi:hypothetical protein|tara:strand:- start:818 stop:3751 length:2934 start_codon:yes stop_codon:yes gene_type:complete